METIEAGDDNLLNECMASRDIIRKMYLERARRIYEWTLPEFWNSKRGRLQ